MLSHGECQGASARSAAPYVTSQGRSCCGGGEAAITGAAACDQHRKSCSKKKKVYSVIVQDDDCLVWTDPHCAFFFFLPLGRCRWPALGGKTRPIASEKRKIAHTNTLDASISTWDAPDGERRWRRRGANRHAVPGSILLQHTYPPPSSSSSCEHFRRLRIILRIIAVF